MDGLHLESLLKEEMEGSNISIKNVSFDFHCTHIHFHVHENGKEYCNGFCVAIPEDAGDNEIVERLGQFIREIAATAPMVQEAMQKILSTFGQPHPLMQPFNWN
jgi:hypothetical protein